MRHFSLKYIYIYIYTFYSLNLSAALHWSRFPSSTSLFTRLSSFFFWNRPQWKYFPSRAIFHIFQMHYVGFVSFFSSKLKCGFFYLFFLLNIIPKNKPQRWLAKPGPSIFEKKLFTHTLLVLFSFLSSTIFLRFFFLLRLYPKQATKNIISSFVEKILVLLGKSDSVQCISSPAM